LIKWHFTTVLSHTHNEHIHVKCHENKKITLSSKDQRMQVCQHKLRYMKRYCIIVKIMPLRGECEENFRNSVYDAIPIPNARLRSDVKSVRPSDEFDHGDESI
jgi:hypothetical protein